MSYIDNFITCSYKGVPFLLLNEPNEQGLRSIVYNPVGTDKQYINTDLGKMPSRFTIDMILNEVALGEDADTLLKRMRHALEGTKEGRLSLTSYGVYTVKPISSYKVKHDLNNAGSYIITCTFGVDNGGKLKTGLANVFGNIQLAADAINDLVDTFEETYSIPEFATEVQHAVNTIESLSSVFNNAILDEVKGIGELKNVIDNARELVLDPISLGTKTAEGFLTVQDDLTNNPEGFNILTSTFSTLQVPKVIPGTGSIVGRKNEVSKQLTKLVGGSFLALLYDFSSRETYTTKQDVLATRLLLDAAYNILDKPTELNSLRSGWSSVLKDKRVNARDLITITLSKYTTARELSYRFTGSTEFADFIKNSNPDQDPNYLIGKVTVLA